MKVKDINPSVLPINVAVNSVKPKDRDKLMELHFRKDWRVNNTLNLYKNREGEEEDEKCCGL